MLIVSLFIAFAAAAIVNYLQLKERAAWFQRSTRAGYVFDGLGEMAIIITVILVAEYSWIILPFSVAGVLVGRWLSERF